MNPADPPDVYTLEPREVARAFGAASHRYDAAARLQRSVRAELLSRAHALQLSPRVVLDLGTGTGEAAAQLKRRYRGAAVIAADISPQMLEATRRRSHWWRPLRCVEADARALPFESASIDLLFTSLMLQWIDPPDVALAEMRRVLRPGGLLLASSFGPETLQELRAAWATVDEGVHVNRFVDVHDLGGALQRAGFIEPVLDVDRHVQQYPDLRALMGELKSIGAHNVNAGRNRALTGKSRMARVQAAYEQLRVPGGLPATWQVVYAVAWAPAPDATKAGSTIKRETRIGLEAMRSSLGRPRGGRP
ncbi:MAG: malonyl-ACP O-methyltransferase BioC [Pseudomonadota bacterium]